MKMSWKASNKRTTMKNHRHMRRLTDMKLLEGQTEEISMTELRQRPGDVID